MVYFVPYAGFLPVSQSSPAGHSTAATHFLWQVFPSNAGFEHKQNSGQGGSVGDWFSARIPESPFLLWQYWFYDFP
jgi:hypothetical protein